MILFFVVYKTKVIKMRNAMWVGGGITGMGEIPVLGVKEKGIAKVIRDIFRNGEQGFFYDPTNLSTLYQDAAGTVPVTAVGQPTAKMQDLSGQGIHALQPDANLRPITLRGGFQYPDNSPGFIVDVPVELTDCTIIVSSQTKVLGITTGQAVSAGSIYITPDGFCMVINRMLTEFEIVALKAATRSTSTQLPYWQLNSQSLMWNPEDITLMWS